jgi:hypothetical protein
VALSESCWDLLETLAAQEDHSHSSQHRHQQSPIELEVARYLEITPKATSATVDVLAWWKAQAPNLPLLSEVARRVLAIPASSTSSERVFSSSGNVVTSQRMNLDPVAVKKLVFIHDNWPKVTIKKWNLKAEQEGQEEKEESDNDE